MIEYLKFKEDIGVLEIILNNISLKILNSLKNNETYNIDFLIDEQIKKLKFYLIENDKLKYQIKHTLEKYYYKDLKSFLKDEINNNIDIINRYYKSEANDDPTYMLKP